MNKPTQQEIWDEDLGEPIDSKVINETRWGVILEDIYRREEDSTYWKVTYEISTDGDNNDLREGNARVVQVSPKLKQVVYYKEIK